MNKNCMGNEKEIMISARCIEDGEFEETFGEPVMKICWKDAGVGVFVGMKSKETYIFATDQDMKNCISAVWDHWEVTAAVVAAGYSEGVDGVIKVCMDFVMAFAADLLEWLTEQEETA